MRTNAAELIRAWFLEHDGDGDFASGIRAFPYSVIGSADTTGRIIFTTKPSIVSALIHEYDTLHGLGMIGRYGLPNAADLRWIRKLLGQNKIFFLGDMDPVDLLTFAWLAESLRPRQVTHLGVNDAFLKAMRFSWSKSFFIPCATSERESLAFLKDVLPDLRGTIGQKCARTLERGEKIELEVILGNRGKAAAALQSLLF